MWYRELLRYVKRPHRWILPSAVAQNGHIVHDGVRPAVAQGLQGGADVRIRRNPNVPVPQSATAVGPPPPATDKLTDSPLEDDSVQGRDEKKTGEPEPDEAARRQ